MENNEEVNISEKIEGKTTDYSKAVSIISLVSTIIMLIILLVVISNSNERISALEEKLTTLENDDTTSEYNNVQTRLDSLSNSIATLNMQHRMSGSGVVTDELVIDKATFLFNTGVIDVETQPGVDYLGKGKFDMSDREVRAMVEDLLKEAEEMYTSYSNDPEWGSGPITVTIKNYEIGTFENGEFELKGE